jgi:hypothetical protein
MIGMEARVVRRARAAAGVGREMMMRRKERRGEKECRGRGEMEERVVCSVAREGGEKMRGLERFCGGAVSLSGGFVGGEMGRGVSTVIMRVFEGGEGCVSEGRVERSRERGVGVLCVGGLAEGEVGGEVWGAGMVAVGEGSFWDLEDGMCGDNCHR